MYNWHISLFIIFVKFVKYACAVLFLNYIEKL